MSFPRVPPNMSILGKSLFTGRNEQDLRTRFGFLIAGKVDCVHTFYVR